MLNIYSNQFPDFKKYEQILNEHKTIYLDDLNTKVNKVYDLEISNVIRNYLNQYMIYKSNGYYRNVDDRTNVREFLVKYCNVPSKAFSIRGVQGYSCDKDKVIVPLYNKGYDQEFLGNYIQYSEYNSLISKVNSMLEKHTRPSYKKSYTGRRLGEISYELARGDTGRYYTKNYSVQSIPRDYLSNICAPEGYFLFWFDFSQIDLRVVYNILLREPGSEEDGIWDRYKDKYEAFARLAYRKSGKPFNLEEFKANRPKYKEGILGKIYGSSSQTLYEKVLDWDVVKQIDNYFDNCERYQEYKKNLKDATENSLEISITDYFGVVRNIPVDLHDKDATIRKGLNTPVQSTSNSVFIHMVNHIFDRFRNLGYNKEQFSMYMPRHDEAVLLISTDCLKDLWILKDCITMQLDDWEPLTTDFHIGYNYKVEDPALMQFFDNISIKKHERMTMAEPKPRTTDYQPTSKIQKLYLAQDSKGNLACTDLSLMFVMNGCKDYDTFSEKIAEYYGNAKIHSLQMYQGELDLEYDNLFMNDVTIMSHSKKGYSECRCLKYFLEEYLKGVDISKTYHVVDLALSTQPVVIAEKVSESEVIKTETETKFFDDDFEDNWG